MIFSERERDLLIHELCSELAARPDGSGRNLIAARCPYCGRRNKFGVYIGTETERKKPFSSHCFSCGMSHRELTPLLVDLHRTDLIAEQVCEYCKVLDSEALLQRNVREEIDDELVAIELPEGYCRIFEHPYLEQRNFTVDDYDCFPVGLSSDFRFENYVVFPITDQGKTAGYICRHVWPKERIDGYNRYAKRRGKFPLLRYRNSTENAFSKLLYNYDAIGPETRTVIITEGVFDVVSLVRKLGLYEDKGTAVVASFGKKLSLTQIYKIQSKGVRRVVVAYDGDAVEQIKLIADSLNQYFPEVLIADIADPRKDADEMSSQEVRKTFAERLKKVRDYKLTKIQEL